MKRILVFLVGMWVLMSVHAKAQVVVPDQNQPTKLGKNVYGLGFAAGIGTGLGISFRHHLPSEISYQIVGGIIKIDTKLYYDIGLEAQYDLMRGESTRFFAGGGFGYFYSGESGSNTLSGPFRITLGVGGEFSNIRFVHLTLEGMFTYFSDGTILPLPQMSIHYYFF